MEKSYVVVSLTICLSQQLPTATVATELEMTFALTLVINEVWRNSYIELKASASQIFA